MNDRPLSPFMRAGMALFGLAGLLGFVGLVLVALAKARDGQLMETYRTVWLFELNYLSVLILAGAVPLVGLIAGYFAWKEHRLEQDFLRKYKRGQ